MKLQGSSVYGIFQARKLEWVAISFSRGSSLPWDRICVSYIAGGFFITEPPVNPVQFSSAQSCPTMDCSKPGFSVHYQLPELMQTHIHWLGDASQPSYPLSSPSCPALNLTQNQGLFKSVSSSHQVAKGLELQLQPQSIQWLSRLTLFRIDWFDLLAIQRTLESFLQHHSLKTSILWHSAFFILQLSHSHMTTGKP